MSSLRFEFDAWWPSSTHYVAPKSSAWVHLQKIQQKFSINEGQQSLLSVCFHGKFCTVLEVKCCHKWWKCVKLEWNLTTIFIMNCVGLQGLCHMSEDCGTLHNTNWRFPGSAISSFAVIRKIRSSVHLKRAKFQMILDGISSSWVGYINLHVKGKFNQLSINIRILCFGYLSAHDTSFMYFWAIHELKPDPV